MTKLSAKRQSAIYQAVTERLMDLRIELSRNDLNGHPRGDAIDHKIAQAMEQAASAAVKAAKGEV